MSITVTPEGEAFLALEEGIAGHPYWPGGGSGITLDIGYDLGQQSLKQFSEDWRDLLEPQPFGALVSCVGKKGAEAKALLITVKGLSINRDAAMKVFRERTLPRYVALAEQTFPGLEHLYWQAQAALVSLCFNRGGIPVHTRYDETDSEMADRYQQEREIQRHVRDGNVDGIAKALDAMGSDGPESLWPGPTPPNPGLRKRRQREAALVRSGFPA